MRDSRLPFDGGSSGLDSRLDARDRAGRMRAVDPRYNVVLEASAGTGKTKVLVDRYVNLLDAGVKPRNILAMTFTRKAAAEMRERIVKLLHEKTERGEIPLAQWRELRDQLGDVAISTIDAFCLSLLREFPLEADLDPGFSMADETEISRLVNESLDRALQVCRHLTREDEDVALVFAHLGERRVRRGLTMLLDRRIVAPQVLARYLEAAPPGLDAASVTARGARALAEVFANLPGGLDAFLESGPPAAPFLLLARDLRHVAGAVTEGETVEPAVLQAALVRAGDYLLTQAGTPRQRPSHTKAAFASEHEYQTHKTLVARAGEGFAALRAAHHRELNLLVARGLRCMFAVASTEYRRTLDAHAALDFSDVLLRALALLRQMGEFAQSRYRLESRYQHLLVDEFQDTSRAQWELVSLLVQSWGAGAGLSAEGPLLPSIFIVGDRKQSIYGFREADVSILREAGRYLGTLRPGGDVRHSISRSFRSVPPLLAFVNDVCTDMQKAPAGDDRFEYEEQDRFPVEGTGAGEHTGDAPLGLVVADEPEASADVVAAEIARLIEAGTLIRDRESGVHRRVRPRDLAVLFRTREAHREFEQALERRGLPVYVYKGLGFYDADEVKDVLAVLRYLADPFSNLRAAALARTRLVRLSDEGLRRMAPHFAQALRHTGPIEGLSDDDARALAQARTALARWRGMVDRVPPADLLDRVLAESAYGLELRGPGFRQARENLKKIRSLVRRVENRGYGTLDRIASYLDRLSVAEEPNAVIDSLDAVNLMTVHAAKGLEFPVVFVVNINKGTGGPLTPVRLSADAKAPAVAIQGFPSEADEDRADREREETKRLVYVALTRARDRLYLAAVRRDGQLKIGRGSLGEVLPAALVGTMAEERDVWIAASGTEHRFQVVRLDEIVCRKGTLALPPGSGETAGELDRTTLPVTPAPTTVTALVVPVTTGGGSPSATATSQKVGTLVHRLLERLGLDGPDDPAVILEAARRLLSTGEADDPVELEALAAESALLYGQLRRHPYVRRFYGEGERLHEVPFSTTEGGRTVRGTIDCLVRTGGQVTILEFKTGRYRPWHAAQLARYQRAVERLFPGIPVDGRVVYADGLA